MKKALLMVAGGSGLRMGGGIPKQYMELAGKPLIIHALERFIRFDPDMLLVVALAPSHRDHWTDMCKRFPIKQDIVLASGGESRFDSVRNGLEHIPDGMLVGIHDAVRPLVARETLLRAYESADKWGSGIPVIDMEDSVRKLDAKGGSEVIDREALKRVQTPQVFQSARIKEAYRQSRHTAFTDDASVYESCFGQVRLVEGNRENIKITTPADMYMAETLIRSGAQSSPQDLS